ncbi:scavenger receptor class B member 1-like isoform X2 [Limulus polyphemus]|uniref:Scavenger receptor class B member 1 n=1 Tax=Limulus polyphemus TaxID=6850 RepID=A0ABM1TN44_LIMPO|nr:scavenger receptor class B member 1-like isoform X2 [Limulus polyphemus]
MWARFKKMVVTGAIGFAIFILGLTLLFSFPVLFRYLLYENLPLKNGSISYKMWKNIPIPIYQRIYFFNMTNPEEFLQKGTKPKLQELGPYTYRSWWVKRNITWHHNDTVTYREKKKNIFLPELSTGSENDLITTINFPLVAAAAWLRNANSVEKISASIAFFLLKETVFIRRSVRQLTYEGYHDYLTEIASLINPDIPKTRGYFGWLYGRNNSDDGVFTVFTGKDKINKFNLIESWNGASSLKYWNGTCNQIEGTNGELNPPLKEGQDTITIFQPDLCRSWKLEYKEEIKNFGMKSRRFTVKTSVLANSTENPENSCFSTRRHLPSGVMDMSPCKYGSPVGLSLPHFYRASPSYLKAVEGLQPNESRHEFFLDVHPVSGLSTNIGARFQINAILEQDKIIRQFSNITELVLPILWQEVTGFMTKELVEELIRDMENPPFYASICSYCLLAVGGLLLLIATSLFFYHRIGTRQSRRGSPLLKDEDRLEENHSTKPQTFPEINGHTAGDV